jgi:hypothetical protein
VSDISELFDRNPLQLSDQDLGKIVERMRQNQTQHELGVKLPAVPKVPRKPSKGADLLKDLGF